MTTLTIDFINNEDASKLLRLIEALEMNVVVRTQDYQIPQEIYDQVQEEHLLYEKNQLKLTTWEEVKGKIDL